MNIVTFKAGETLFREGDPSDKCFRILSGKAEVRLADPRVFRKARDIGIATCGPTEFVGEMSLLLEGGRTATVVALEELRCESYSREEFFAILEDDPREAVAYLKLLLKRLREDNRRLAQSYSGRG